MTKDNLFSGYSILKANLYCNPIIRLYLSKLFQELHHELTKSLPPKLFLFYNSHSKYKFDIDIIDKGVS